MDDMGEPAGAPPGFSAEFADLAATVAGDYHGLLGEVVRRVRRTERVRCTDFGTGGYLFLRAALDAEVPAMDALAQLYADQAAALAAATAERDRMKAATEHALAILHRVESRMIDAEEAAEDDEDENWWAATVEMLCDGIAALAPDGPGDPGAEPARFAPESPEFGQERPVRGNDGSRPGNGPLVGSLEG